MPKICILYVCEFHLKYLQFCKNSLWIISGTNNFAIYCVNENGWWWSFSPVTRLRLRSRQAWCGLSATGTFFRVEVFAEEEDLRVAGGIIWHTDGHVTVHNKHASVSRGTLLAAWVVQAAVLCISWAFVRGHIYLFAKCVDFVWNTDLVVLRDQEVKRCTVHSFCSSWPS